MRQRRLRRRLLPLLALCVGAPVCWAGNTPLHLPWQEAGLTEREAAAHLLSRLTFGPAPGQVDEVLALGLEAWVEKQLGQKNQDLKLERRLRSLDALELSALELAETFVNPGFVLGRADEMGLVDRAVLLGTAGGSEGHSSLEPRERRRILMELRQWAKSQGYRSQRELLKQLAAQKLLRAVYSKNQLHEVLTDFWFNHFNVSISDVRCRGFVLSYERDALRPHLLADFRTLLGATSRHPAMLFYLDNTQSTVGGDMAGGAEGGRSGGLNENFARELMELHTLGVGGGYEQRDVVEVARAFTGWTVLPQDEIRARKEAQADGEAAARDVVLDDLFFFRAIAHDAGAKVVLGQSLLAGRGVEDGEEVLDLLARHPSTARHLSRKLARRFVSDEPPEALVERLVARFSETGGDLEVVLRSLLESPEFWAPEARRQKIKSPFELAASALRALGAEVADPLDTLQWISRMGQHLYAYPAPTGFPDRAEHWVNTGSLLSRMNFGLQLANGYVSGVWFDLEALNAHREPGSIMEALETYLRLLLPERDTREAVRQLERTVSAPDLALKVAAALPGATAQSRPLGGRSDAEVLFFPELDMGKGRGGGGRRQFEPKGATGPVAQVVGLILGSPEFQRR